MSDSLLRKIEETKQQVSALQLENEKLRAAVQCTNDLAARMRVVQGERDALYEQNNQLTSRLMEMSQRVVNPMYIAGPTLPTGKALLFTFGGPVIVQDIEWQYEFASPLEPKPRTKVVNQYGRSFRLLYSKKDVAHQNSTLALYVAE